MSDAEIVQAIEILNLVTHFDVAASTLFVWDWLLTLRMEVELVWKSKWNFMKVLYLAQRYLPFVDTIGLVICHQLGINMAVSTCQRVYYASGYLIVVGFILSELILTLRAWAVWNRDRLLMVVLSSLFVALWSLDLAFITLFLRSVGFAPEPYAGFTGCFVIQANHFLMLCWVVLIAWDTIVLLVMLVAGYKAYKTGGPSALLDVVYRDGIIYYFYVFVLSTINVIVVKTLPPEYEHLLTSTERCLHSVLTSRVLLDIRAYTVHRRRCWADGLTDLEVTVDFEFKHEDPVESLQMATVPVPQEEALSIKSADVV
ncbi:hypothetical protein CVT26_013655 [Gymnopilus dilepis]|uniref:DUF6533 domain-containing protein n=1 Tax=Gymnopilus dilepis TaxID=231916 RepID=A0A409YWH5_9AGAR|nr:hypothetical protein CVT26_013655 [Gymnopilus dilepis]